MGRGRGSDRSRRGWSTRCRWHRMAGVTAGLARRRGHQRIVQVPPVARLDVLPGLVVGESGLVAQRRGRRVGIFCLATGGLGQHTKRQAQHQRRCQAVSELVHCSKPCEKAGEVPADAHACAKRTHEPHRASSGGLKGSDGSWGSVLAVRLERRRRSEEVGKTGRTQFDRRTQPGCSAGHWRCRTRGRAHVALVGARRMGMVSCLLIVVRMVGLVVDLVAVAVIRVVLASVLGWHAACRRTDHGCSHRTPDG
ncbi:hypothetical protein DES41_110252 [Pseudorhodoferax soli]|uniref:Uncharacterized protein n=1 Tax=Pseudorhodoferax soli TaxID=545864 RepID=A0A368XK76_9BURK|nr:hypothetical protein DES41_110252 [Pseudorhodoferax soli]